MEDSIINHTIMDEYRDSDYYRYDDDDYIYIDEIDSKDIDYYRDDEIV